MNVSIKKLYIDLDLLNILIFPDFFLPFDAFDCEFECFCVGLEF
jgi:hypothetical protein